MHLMVDGVVKVVSMWDDELLSLTSDRHQPLWLVVVSLAGAPIDGNDLEERLRHYNAEHAFAAAVRYGPDRVELSYWDEGRSVRDVYEVAMNSWSETSHALALTGWQLVGIEVVDQCTIQDRIRRGRGPELLVPGEIRSF